jgi:flagellar motor protein MotB
MNSHDVNINTQESSANNLATDSALDFLTALNLVASGNLDEAERLLRKSEEQQPTLAALDLLARIAVQKGQFEQAGQLWKAVLERDPTHEAAKAAIKLLGSPWIKAALIKRISFLASIVVVLCLALVGLLSIFNVDQPSQISKVQTAKTPSFISAPGYSVNTNNQGETNIVFDDGLFILRGKLKNSAKDQLAIFAGKLKKNAPNSQIVVEGHTDSYSMRKNGLYKDNYALGLQRALIVAEVLRSDHQIAGERILVTSSGDKNPPFPEVDNKSKLKNRTVVIRLF